jgi:Uma2 family endonuclease
MTTTATPPTAAAAPSPGTPAAAPQTLADLVRQLGGVPLERIRCQPPPGTATEEDVLRPVDGEKRLFELVDGTLVAKAMGYYESVLAMVLGRLIGEFLDQHDLGLVSGEAGMLRLAPGQVRGPDVAFVRWERFPGGKMPTEPIPGLAPDLAVEVLSRGNTEAEMQRKLHEYFAAGVRLVWYLDPEPRTVRVYTGPTEMRLLTEGETLEGDPVLPGFRLLIREWFERAERGRGRD